MAQIGAFEQGALATLIRFGQKIFLRPMRFLGLVMGIRVGGLAEPRLPEMQDAARALGDASMPPANLSELKELFGDGYDKPAEKPVLPLYAGFNKKHLDGCFFELGGETGRVSARGLLNYLRDSSMPIDLSALGGELSLQIENFRGGGAPTGRHEERYALADALWLKFKATDGTSLFKHLVDLLGLPTHHRSDAEHIAGFSRQELMGKLSPPTTFPATFRTILAQQICIWGDKYCYADEFVIMPEKQAAKAGYEALINHDFFK